MLQKLVNNESRDWEVHLSDALLALRNCVSTTTGFTPFQLLYGRRARLPLAKALTARESHYQVGSRLEKLYDNLKKAQALTHDSRRYNRERLAARANAKDIKVGDTVVVFAPERLTLTSRWDPQYEVFRVRGLVCWVRNQQTGKERVLNRGKLRIVDPELVWDDIRSRPIRNPRRGAVPPALFPGADIVPELAEPETPALEHQPDQHPMTHGESSKETGLPDASERGHVSVTKKDDVTAVPSNIQRPGRSFLPRQAKVAIPQNYWDNPLRHTKKRGGESPLDEHFNKQPRNLTEKRHHSPTKWSANKK